MHTLYQLADAEIRSCIDDYLALARATNGFTAITEAAIDTDRKAVIVLAGMNASLEDLSPQNVVREWERRKAIPLDVETGITAGVYANIRNAGVEYLEEVKVGTSAFTEWDPDFIRANPHTLPLLQHLAGVFSKAALVKQVEPCQTTTSLHRLRCASQDCWKSEFVPKMFEKVKFSSGSNRR